VAIDIYLVNLVTVFTFNYMALFWTVNFLKKNLKHALMTEQIKNIQFLKVSIKMHNYLSLIKICNLLFYYLLLCICLLKHQERQQYKINYLSKKLIRFHKFLFSFNRFIFFYFFKKLLLFDKDLNKIQLYLMLK